MDDCVNVKSAEEWIPTRQSLLSRLRDWGDEDGWKVFFDTYWKLIYNAAIAAGLTDAEAQDVVQETVISVMKKMPDFRYESEKGSFKKWLQTLTTWRIRDQLRRRHPGITLDEMSESAAGESMVDATSAHLDELWDKEWEANLLDAAVERVKRNVDSKHYQIFDLYAVKKWPISKIAQTLQVSSANVYIITHRISNAIKKEVARLKSKPV
jgi:RNA polymerase sigma factor (sigma-70 family)